MADLTAYVPRLLLEWQDRYGAARHAAIDGTLVFADVSGFTRLSEALERKSGREGAEEMAEVINYLFGELLMLAAVRGGEMLKYGGDAMLLFFSGEQHALRAAAASADMQDRLREIGRVDTGGAGVVRLRMSVGAHSGSFDFFVGGRIHQELIVAGPDTSITVAMEAAADASEVLMSPAMAAQLGPRNVGKARDGGVLLRGHPKAPLVEPVPISSGRDGGAYLSKPLLEHLSSGILDPEHRLATVGFLHFFDLDRLLLAGDQEEATKRVDDVLTLVEEVCNEFGVSFLATDLAADGGKVMAASGAPTAHGDDEERMLRAARRILDAGPALPVRIGVNRGHVFAGDVGPPFRRTYTAMGDVTNTAARLMGRADGGQCVTLEPLLRAATSNWTAERLESFVAKGKAHALVPWLVGAPLERRSRSSTTPLIGRENELATLTEALAASKAAAQTIEISGEPGLGKSRLVAELCAIARADGRTVLTVACDPFSATIPYRAVGQLSGIVIGHLASGDLRDLVTARVPQLVEELPLLGIAFGLELPATPTTAQLDHAVLPARIATAAAALLAELIAEGSVIVVEDAHWLDPASAAVFEDFRSARGDAATLVCCTRRDGDKGWLPQHPDVSLKLDALDERSALALVEAASTMPLLPEDARRLAARAAGNPLFVEQLAMVGSDSDLPDSLEELLAIRIDELSSPARDSLRRLSILGPVFDSELIPAVAPEGLTDGLEAFVKSSGARTRFAHALLQETAYAGLAFRRRRELHRKVAAHLLRQGAAETHVEELAQHCHAGSMWPEAWRYATSAARAAEQRYAFAIAAVHWERAARAARFAGSVSAADIADTWFACGEAYRRAGQIREAEQAFRSGRKDAALGSANSIALAAAIGRALLQQGDRQAANRWARKAHREAVEHGSVPFEVEALVDELRLSITYQRNKPREVIAFARDLATRAASAGNTMAQARAQSFLQMAASDLDLPEYEVEGALARTLAERAGDIRMLVSVLSNLAESAARRGDWSRATALYREAAHEADRAGFALGRAIIDNNAAEILLQQGRVDESFPLFERSRTTAAAAGHWYVGFFIANIGWARGLQGNLDLADVEFAEATRMFAALGMPGMTAEVARRRVAVTLAHGDGATALGILDSQELAREVPLDPLLQSAKSNALRQLNRIEEAREAAERATRLALDADNDYAKLSALEALARLTGEVPREIAELSAALGIEARPLNPSIR